MEDSPSGPDNESQSDSRPKMVYQALKASQLKEVLQHYGEALRSRRKGIDDLNVYPVPDGDTGTNMSLTVQSVVTELKSAAADDMHSISAAITKGAIMGARGNSGAILAQALRGIAESVKEKTSIGPSDVAEALEKARKSAYESVLKPVEGTILTVLSAAADAARKSVEAGHSLPDQLDHVRAASAEALARTPDLLPVLKQAGVVDAGGSGFLLFVDALRYVATGEPIPGVTDVLGITEPDLSEAHSEISDLRWEVMFLMDAEDEGIPEMRQKWDEVGDSIVVVGGDGLWNCHIHADETEPVLAIAQKYGTPRDVRIADLQQQAADHAHDLEEQSEPCESAVVAVVNGEGIKDIYKSFGVQGIVSGGQSMNPSVSDLLAKVDGVNSSSIIVLPNNKNIIAAAKQVNELTDKSVEVIESVSVVEGMTALLAYDSSANLATNLHAMREAMTKVTTGEVTQAVRSTNSDAGPIKKGDWLGIGPDGISVVAASMSQALCELVETMADDDHELLTLIEGVGASEECTQALRTWLGEHRSNVELEVQVGGQSLYPYLLGLE